MLDEIDASSHGAEPMHPGTVLRTVVLPSSGMTVGTMASSLGVRREHLHRLLSGRSGISPEMALRLGKFCGNGERYWLRMQRRRDVWEARRRLGTALDSIPTLAGVGCPEQT